MQKKCTEKQKKKPRGGKINTDAHDPIKTMDVI